MKYYPDSLYFHCYLPTIACKNNKVKTVNFRDMSQAKPIKCINFFAIELQYYSNGFIDRNDKPNTLISDR